ncbi:MAG: 23S rRNA pseudouridine(1911/1915/1917) synthase RluD [Gammaproteobacteria bacterium]|nr:MAG: 23S rRNA pseudouridine(1911/1915/1917) synthase RluD [Gammaproteobacteria bacterium]
MTEISLQAKISQQAAGQRLDQALAQLFPEHSRSRLQQWIKKGKVAVNGKVITRTREKVMGQESISINTELETEVHWQAQDIAVDIVYEDEELMVINKAASMVVHPAAGNWDGTLVNALLHHHPQLEQLPRAGIVHRLDKDTSGLMVVAKTLRAHTHLVNELQARKVNRQYLCLANGAITAGNTIDQPIARHPTKRKQMAVIATGKTAITHYRIERRFKDYTFLRVKLETGRTHQIRVHMAWLKHPLVGDPVYGGRLRLPKAATETLIETLRNFGRQALHATELGLIHPGTKQPVSWQADIPSDMAQLIETIAAEEVSE